MKIILITTLSVILLWSLWGYFSSRVAQAQYTVIAKTQDYEIRLYAEHLEAQTAVEGPNSVAMNSGFRIIARYIFGGNKNNQSISMTAPVLASIEGKADTMAFIMPKPFTLQTLPTPQDPRVKIVNIPEKKVAALRFRWYRSDSRLSAMRTRLLASLARDGVSTKSRPVYAGYNAPWTPFWMTRHEILVDIE